MRQMVIQSPFSVQEEVEQLLLILKTIVYTDFLTYSVYLIWSTNEKITVRLNTKNVNGTRENASKNWEMIGCPLIQKKIRIMVVAN